MASKKNDLSQLLQLIFSSIISYYIYSNYIYTGTLIESGWDNYKQFFKDPYAHILIKFEECPECSINLQRKISEHEKEID